MKAFTLCLLFFAFYYLSAQHGEQKYYPDTDPLVLEKLEQWQDMKFGLLMGTYIMTPIIMSIVFYGMFMPMGLIMRLFGKDGMERKLDANADTYRVIVEPPPTKNLEKPF